MRQSRILRVWDRLAQGPPILPESTWERVRRRQAIFTPRASGTVAALAPALCLCNLCPGRHTVTAGRVLLLPPAIECIPLASSPVPNSPLEPLEKCRATTWQ